MRNSHRVSAASPQQPAPSSFESALGIERITANWKRFRRRTIAWRVLALIVFAAICCMLAIPTGIRWHNDAAMRQTADATGATGHHAEALGLARQYNERLKDEGQATLSEAGNTEETADDEYWSLLDAGNGLIGKVSVPTASIDLPFYHGTSEQTLEAGAGHLRGTSLPVGGESTHTVITAHRGLVRATMFTHLDQVRLKDYMYLTVMGETYAYRVDRITVIEPTDTSQLLIEPGEDRLTLLTCTPYGVNTHRLLVSGSRTTMPSTEVPTPVDAKSVGIAVFIAVFAAGMVTLTVRRLTMKSLAREHPTHRR